MYPFLLAGAVALLVTATIDGSPEHTHLSAASSLSMLGADLDCHTWQRLGPSKSQLRERLGQPDFV